LPVPPIGEAFGGRSQAAALTLAVARIKLHAVVAPRSPRGIPVGEHASLGSVMIGKAWELGVRSFGVPAYFQGVGEVLLGDLEIGRE
jgi:hypothetical protein